MVHKSRPRSSNLFLMELILAIFFFSAASAICLQFFVKSHLLSREAGALNQAVSICSSMAEFIQVSDSSKEAMELLQAEYPEGSFTETELLLYYDKNFMICNADESAYLVRLQLEEREQMLEALLQVTESSPNTESKNLYELNVLHHLARRTTYE